MQPVYRPSACAMFAMRVNHKLDKFLNGRVVVGRVLPVYQFWLLVGMALAVALSASR